MSKVLYERDGRIGRITLNRPEVLNAIDDDLPVELEAAVTEADADPEVHLMILSGAGRAFCAGYDLNHYTSSEASNTVIQDMPCLLYTSPSPRDKRQSRMPSSA